MNRIAALATTLTLLIATSANSAFASEEGQKRRYETIWTIKANPAQLGARSVAVTQTILEQRLLPLGLAVADEDIRSASGEILVNKGVQLFQLQIATGRTFCVADVPRPTAWRSFMLGGGNLQLCLVDADADGVFDGQFNGGNPMRGVPFISGHQPKQPKQASGRYSLVDPAQFALNYTVRISLLSVKTQARGEPVIIYGINFGDDQTRQGLTSALSGQLGSNSVLGAHWNISKANENSITVNVDQIMPEQPFQ